MSESGKRRVFDALEVLARLGLGGLFAFSAVGKIKDPALFADAVGRYEMLPQAAVGLFALVLPMVELLSGIALIFTVWVREAALLIAAQLVMFMIALAQALLRGLDISCGCFGMPSTGGPSELVFALARDMVLLVPAVWLLFRGNGWIFSALASRRAAVLAVALAPVLLSAHPAADGPAVRGEWNSSFLRTFEQAQKDRTPMVLVCRRSRCVFCSRLESVCHSDVFLKWQKQRAPYLANVLLTGNKTEDARQAEAFVAAITNLVDFPQVCVWTPLADGGARTNVFVGQRGLMPGERSPSLAVEFTTALEKLVVDAYSSAGSVTVATDGVRKVSFKVVGGEGTVDITPPNGEMYDTYDSVYLNAKPGRDSVFLCWRDPSGAKVASYPRYCVRGKKPAGCYTAEFRNRKEIAPPAFSVPATSLWARVGIPFSYEIYAEPACLPLKFSIRKPPIGIVLNSMTGCLSGIPRMPGTNLVEIIARGNDVKATMVKKKMTIIVEGEVPAEEVSP